MRPNVWLWVCAVGSTMAIGCVAADAEFDPATADAIGPAEARACLEHKGELRFGRLRALGPQEAAILATHEHGLSFDALRKLQRPTAEALANCKASLKLNAIEQLDAGCAEALANCKAPLELEGLTALDSPALAATLASQGKVHLPKITTLKKPVLEGFCKKPCDLYLPGLSTLEPEDAEALRHHEGVLDIENLVDPSPEVLACILCNQGPIGLGSIDTLRHPTPQPVLDALSNHPCSLCLNGLKELTREEAEAIRERTHHTHLQGLSTLPADIARALVNCKGTIWLLGIERLEPEVVQTLLKHRPQPCTGFVFSVNLPERLQRHEVEAFEKHESFWFGNTNGR